MKVLLRTGALTMMVVSASASEAISAVTKLPEFQDATILEVGIKPIGGEEYAKMTLDFASETGHLIPGLVVADDMSGYQIWQVTVTFKQEVEWDERAGARREQEELDLQRSGEETTQAPITITVPAPNHRM